MHRFAWLAVALFALDGCTTQAPAAPRSPPALLAPTKAVPTAVRCALDAPIGEVSVEEPKPDERHFVFELTDAPFLWEAAPHTAELDAYRRAVAGRLGTEPSPRELLERQARVFGPLGGGDALNIGLTARGEIGRIQPATCLELAIWSFQSSRWPMLAHPTELGAFILRGGGRVRIYLSSLDRVGQKLRGAVTDRVEADERAGFRLVAHLHNHPFLFDRQAGDRLFTTESTLNDVGGALAPSSNDVAFYRSMRARGLQEAWITNGLDSIHVPADAFGVLAAAR